MDPERAGPYDSRRRRQSHELVHGEAHRYFEGKRQQAAQAMPGNQSATDQAARRSFASLLCGGPAGAHAAGSW
jgi:hypothetical protein